MAQKEAAVPAGVIRKIQKDFELDNNELAALFGISTRSLLSWLKDGIQGRREQNIAKINSLLIMKHLAENDPDNFISFDQLKKIVKNAVTNPKFMYYMFHEHRDSLGPSLGIFNHTGIITVLSTIIYSLYLGKKEKKVVFEEDPSTYEKSLYNYAM